MEKGKQHPVQPPTSPRPQRPELEGFRFVARSCFAGPGLTERCLTTKAGRPVLRWARFARLEHPCQPQPEKPRCSECWKSIPTVQVRSDRRLSVSTRTGNSEVRRGSLLESLRSKTAQHASAAANPMKAPSRLGTSSFRSG